MRLMLLSFCFGTLGAWLILKIGSRIGTDDIPNKRSSHTAITPKGGGVGILAAFLFIAFSLGLQFTFWGTGAVLSIVSFWGDRREISPACRLFVQFLCSCLLLLGFFLPVQNSLACILITAPLSVYMVGTANFYNFMDGIDGIAGISGVVAFGLLAFYTRTAGALDLSTMSLGLTCACLGFLIFNFPKAKIFMGDVGSILLGFLFSAVVIMATKSVVDFVVMSGFLFPFYFDELLTIFLRLKKKESLITPHRRHIYQLLANEVGYAHWKISIAYGAVQLMFGILLINLRSQVLYIMLSYLICSVLFLMLSMVLYRKTSAWV